MSKFSVTVKDAELKRLLGEMEKKAINPKPLFARYWAGVYTEALQNFRMQGSYGDILTGQPSNTFTKWKELGDLQANRRAAKGTGTAILQDSGRLRLSIGTVRRITNKVCECGTDTVYGAVMHFGAEGKNAIRPKRAQWLTLPMPGVKGRARDHQNTFFKRIPSDITGKDELYIFQNTKDGGIKPLYHLVKKVEIPARPFMTIGAKRLYTFQKQALDFITGVPMK